MNEGHDNGCECVACRLQAATESITLGNAQMTLANARWGAAICLGSKSDAEVDLRIRTGREIGRSIQACAAAMNAALDQFEAAMRRTT